MVGRYRRCECGVYVYEIPAMRGGMVKIDPGPEPGSVLITEEGTAWVTGPGDLYPPTVLTYREHQHRERGSNEAT